MSAIASFYVVPSERLADVINAATPTRTLLRGARDTFRDVLGAAARELRKFDGSGWAFGTLDLYLEERHGFMYVNFGDAILSRQLSKARGSDWLVLPAPSAAQLLAMLDGINGEIGDVTAFAASEHGPRDAAEEAQAVLAALATLKEWLAEVPSGSVGLLSIG